MLSSKYTSEIIFTIFSNNQNESHSRTEEKYILIRCAIFQRDKDSAKLAKL